MKVYKLLLFSAVVGVLSSFSWFASSDEKWLSYEPAIVELEGRLTLVPKYGPPNYGEDPKTDEKVKVPILELAEPVNVRGNSQGEVDTESFEDVEEVQLVFITDKIRYRHLVGKRVVAKGTLFQAHTGHHYTNVLMIVHAIREQQKKSIPQ